MKYEIDIPEEELRKEIRDIIARRFAQNAYTTYEERELKRMYREVIKEMIYEPTLKANIIESVVNQAARHISNKAIPLLKGMMKEEQE